MTSIVWLRQDLRLADNPALHEAAKLGPVIPLYILDDARAGDWPLGSASRWWLHHSLEALGSDCPLVLRSGDSLSQLKDLIKQSGAERVYWNRCYEPSCITYDTKVKQALTEQGVEVRSFNGSLLAEPWEIETKSGSFFKVFTPFWKTCLKIVEVPAPLPAPKLTVLKKRLPSDTLNDWKLLPTKPDWAGGLRDMWTPGEAGAQKRLKAFLQEGMESYGVQRDYPANAQGVSHLSPHLHFGEISPRQIWHACRQAGEPDSGGYLRELYWREFSYYLLYHFPQLPEEPFSQKFRAFPWLDQPAHYQAWCRGQTGYPIIDAGMRELWHTGWMHNRVRMIVASFLTKHLLIPWQLGARWFWDCLVDADLASNSASWQWVAGCGADAAPYFRIFNPTLQAERFDPDGDYIRRWCPELQELDKKLLYQPWLAPEGPPNGYPLPLVDHKEARERAMEHYRQI